MHDHKYNDQDANWKPMEFVLRVFAWGLILAGAILFGIFCHRVAEGAEGPWSVGISTGAGPCYVEKIEPNENDFRKYENDFRQLIKCENGYVAKYSNGSTIPCSTEEACKDVVQSLNHAHEMRLENEQPVLREPEYPISNPPPWSYQKINGTPNKSTPTIETPCTAQSTDGCHQ